MANFDFLNCIFSINREILVSFCMVEGLQSNGEDRASSSSRERRE